MACGEAVHRVCAEACLNYCKKEERVRQLDIRFLAAMGLEAVSLDVGES